MSKKKKQKRPVRLKRKAKPRRRKVVHKRRPSLKKRRAPKRVKASASPNRSKERYMLNTDFEFFSELRALILKSSPAEKDRMIRRISRLGRIRLAVISGVFMNDNNTVESFSSVADLFIVGDDINKDRLRIFLRALEAEVGAEIKFTLMEKEEFEYRYGMFDRFVRVLLEGPHEKIINRMGI